MGLSSGSFEAFVERHVDELLRTASVITWDDDAAEDLVQECLLRVTRHWTKVRKMELPFAYARRVLVNLALDDGRRRSRRRAELEPAEAGDGRVITTREPADLRAEAAFDALGDRAELLEAFGALSQQQRTVLMLRYFHDLSESQVARILGCSTGTVKSSASRGLARLRERIANPVPSTEVCEP